MISGLVIANPSRMLFIYLAYTVAAASRAICKASYDFPANQIFCWQMRIQTVNESGVSCKLQVFSGVESQRSGGSDSASSKNQLCGFIIHYGSDVFLQNNGIAYSRLFCAIEKRNNAFPCFRQNRLNRVRVSL